MTYPYAEIESIQPEIFAKIDSEPYFATISLFKIRHEDLQSKINEALGEGTFDPGQSGKLPGACIEVMMPTIDEINGNLSNLEGTVKILVRVIENHEISVAQPGGVGLSAEQIGARLMRVFSQHVNEGIAPSWYVAGMVFNPDLHPLICYDMTLAAEIDFTQLPQTASVTATEPEALTIALACATAESSIYYTTDGSYPYVNNGTATLYTEPFTVEAGTVVRFAAYATGYTGSVVSRITVNS